MPRARVTLERFQSGAFPDVCAKTGERAEYLGRVEASRTPDWPCLLLLFGILPYLIAAAFSTVHRRFQEAIADLDA